MSSLLRVSQLQGDVCPKCGAISTSKITQTHLSTRIGKRNHKNTLGLVKRFHVCGNCGYTGRDDLDNPDNIPFNTIGVREDQLQYLIALNNSLLISYQSSDLTDIQKKFMKSLSSKFSRSNLAEEGIEISCKNIDARVCNALCKKGFLTSFSNELLVFSDTGAKYINNLVLSLKLSPVVDINN
ncbi:hypothetical protein Lepto7375DRAFT_7191 [Leptolyngbya sp. PCC 7375]|nr:hypothetical protein Lepto7375DRAFT_7191 [Leptolyngbya sp. PCC 7375]